MVVHPTDINKFKPTINSGYVVPIQTVAWAAGINQRYIFQDTISCIPVFPFDLPMHIGTSTITQDVTTYIEYNKEVGIAIESKETSSYTVRNS